MLWNIEDIRKMRKQENLTQFELAKLSNVSQSLIAKIESGTLDPGFSNTRKIFLALESHKEKKMLLAKDVMTKHVETINLGSTEEAARIMKKKGYSQLPVVKDNAIIGLVTEKGLIDALIEKKNSIASVMESAPPSVSPETPLKLVVELLCHFPIILVHEKGKLIGAVTKSDVLGKSV